jgi:anti-sigma factor RsiW
LRILDLIQSRLLQNQNITMQMRPDELEYAISQYLDGTLPLLERNALEERLANDCQARAILEEYRKLDATLKTAMPLPDVAWDKFAVHIQQSLADEETPVRHYSLKAMGWTGKLAIAAALLLVASISLRMIPRTSELQQPAGLAVITGPAIEQPTGPVQSDISISPAPTLAGNWRLSEELIARPTVVVIDQVRASGQDNESTLY